jgi:hypothetical protein
MATTVFVSPGVYTREQDFSVFASRIGVTRLGLVGETQKGPAFEPTKVQTTDEFLARFGVTDGRMQLPYVANSFLKQSGELTITRVLGNEGFDSSPAWIIQASGGTKDGATLCVIRSKSEDEGLTFMANSASDVTIANITGALNSFTLSATTGPLTAQTLSALTVSLDETRDDFIVKVLGKNPKRIDNENDFGFYVESIFSHFVRQATATGEITTIMSAITYANGLNFTDYNTSYTNPITPYVVSKVIGSAVRDLFRFQSISDGDSANKEIKISIMNIDDVTKTFDVLVRDYNDTDASIVQIERFRAITLDPTQPNYIAKAIGTTDEEFPRKSLYITLDVAEGHPTNTVPAGFRGYDLRDTGISGGTNADIYYKEFYFSGDSIFKTFLGISELGYTGFTSSQVSPKNAVKTLEHDLFTFQGAVPTGQTTIKGFHMESTAPTADFIVGIENALSAYTKSQRKFTLVPAGGFDGWNKFRYPDFTSASIDADNVVAIKEAIDTMASPEEVDVNLFAVPGVNYDDHEAVVKYALSTIEDRADALYIIDAPRLYDADTNTKGTSSEAVSTLQDTGIDSNYAATYWPWVQISDETLNKFLYVAPTLEVVRAIALTDNVAFPWFAPAGINRGTTSSLVQRADIRLSVNDRDTLYQDRVNPIATFVQQGVVIFGQKTLQERQSALDRVNVRRLLLQVRRLIAAASQTLLFEQNDQTLRDQFLQKVEPILLQIQNQRGLAAFRVIVDDTLNTPEVIDRNTLVGKIQLKPTPAAEFIDLTFQVLPTGANFEDF